MKASYWYKYVFLDVFQSYREGAVAALGSVKPGGKIGSCSRSLCSAAAAFHHLLFSWHSPASNPLYSSLFHCSASACIALCLVGISILYFVAAIWEGASWSPASKLTQGVGFHRRHVLGHKASTPDRGALIGQFEGGRFNLFER